MQGPWGRKESDPTKQLTLSLLYTFIRSKDYSLITSSASCLVQRVWNKFHEWSPKAYTTGGWQQTSKWVMLVNNYDTESALKGRTRCFDKEQCATYLEVEINKDLWGALTVRNSWSWIEISSSMTKHTNIRRWRISWCVLQELKSMWQTDGFKDGGWPSLWRTFDFSYQAKG